MAKFVTKTWEISLYRIKKPLFLKGVIAVCLGKFFQKRSLKDCFSINALNDLKLKESFKRKQSLIYYVKTCHKIETLHRI